MRIFPRGGPLALLLATALLLPSLAASGFAAWSYYETLARGRHDAAHQATVLREHALRVFEAQLTAIAFIDARLGGKSWNQIESSEDVHWMLKSLARASPHIDGLWLVRPDGRTVNSADFFPVPAGTETTERDYYQVLKERDVVHLGQMIRGHLKGTFNFNLSRRRATRDGSFDGLILVTADLGYFDTVWQKASTGYAQNVFILRGDGSILARHPQVTDLPRRIPSESPFFRLLAKAEGAVFEHTSRVDGVRRIYGVEKLGPFDAYIGVGLDRSAVLAPWRRGAALLATTAVVLTVFLVAVVRTARRTERRLAREAARRRNVEASLIAKEEHMNALQAAEAELRKSEARFRALFETSTQGVVHLDGQGRIQDANPTAEELLGIALPDMAGRRILDLGIEAAGEDGRPLPLDERPVARALRTGEVVKDFTMRVRNARTRELRWLLIDAVPQWRVGESQPWSVFLLMSDITEQRRSAEAEKLLAAEVDHRAKNMLALVQAVVRLSRSDSPERLMDAIEGRIAALARAHSLLSGSKWGDVHLRSILEGAVAPYNRADTPERVALSGPETVLKPEAAQPMSLMVHELTTNAAKYGALSLPQGRLRVTWSVDPAGGSLELVWQESDGPPIAAPERVAFGSRLIHLTAEGELGGTVEKDWRREGLRVTVRIPGRHVGGAGARPRPRDLRQRIGERLRRGFHGARVLLAEDNAVIAAELADQLRAMGCAVIGPAATLEEAARLAAAEGLDAALLDIDLHGERAFPVAELLRAKGVPVAFCTGFTIVSELDEHWPDPVVIQKPATNSQLVEALARLLAVPAAA